MNSAGGVAPPARGRRDGLGQKQKYVISPSLAQNPNGMSEKQQKEWLKRSEQWSDMRVNPYVGKRVLGAGSNGIVGVWEYQGNPPPLMPKLIAVKQASDAGGASAVDPLRVESKLLRDILGTNTNHVVKLYKSCYQTGGSGAHSVKDILPLVNAAGVINPNTLIARMYMEYCRNGDMKAQLRKVVDQDEDIPEEYIWRVLHCIASALVVLRHGNENSNAQGPTWNIPIAHFDIKPENILIGNHDRNYHRRLPVFKLADFGLALPIPAQVRTQAQWNAWAPVSQFNWTHDVLWRNTEHYIPPEQIYQNQNDRIGFRTDIWATGVILYEMMTGKVFQTVHGIPAGLEVRQNTFQSNTMDPAVQPFETFGRDIIYRPYSKRLINLTHRCLSMQPHLRPSARRLLRAAEDMVNNVYTPIQTPIRRVQLSQDIVRAPQYNDNLLQRPTQAEINAVGPLVQRYTLRPIPAGVPFWTVAPEANFPALPPLVIAPALNSHAWPWTVTVPNAPAPPNRRTRAADRRDQQDTEWESGQ